VPHCQHFSYEVQSSTQGLKPATNRLNYATARILREYSGVWLLRQDCFSDDGDQRLATLSKMMTLLVYSVDLGTLHGRLLFKFCRSRCPVRRDCV